MPPPLLFPNAGFSSSRPNRSSVDAEDAVEIFDPRYPLLHSDSPMPNIPPTPWELDLYTTATFNQTSSPVQPSNAEGHAIYPVTLHSHLAAPRNPEQAVVRSLKRKRGGGHNDDSGTDSEQRASSQKPRSRARDRRYGERVIQFNILKQPRSKTEMNEDEARKILGSCQTCWKHHKQCPHFIDKVPVDIKWQSHVIYSPFFTKLGNLTFYRNRPPSRHPLQNPRPEVYNLQNIRAAQAPECRKIFLTQRLGRIGNGVLAAEVVQFPPRPTDKLNHKYMRDGKLDELPMPPFCLANIDETVTSMGKFITDNWEHYIAEIYYNAGAEIRMVIEAANEYMSQSKAVRTALRLLAVCRLIEIDWEICDDGDTLGIEIINDPQNPWFGKRPVTPIMDAQLDQIVIQHYLNKHREQLMKELEQRMRDTSTYWYEGFLTVCLLSIYMALRLSHSRRSAERYGAQTRYNDLQLAKEYFNAMDSVFVHFRVKMNASFADGVPIANLQKILTGAGLNEFVIMLWDHLCDAMMVRQFQYTALRDTHQCEHELYFLHQVFYPNWRPLGDRVEDALRLYDHGRTPVC